MNERAAVGANALRKQAASDPTATLVFDIFSDDPKLIEYEKDGTTVTERHPDEYFWCERCGRVFVDHYTWERYQSDGKCLNCARKDYLANPDNWIQPGGKLESLKNVPHLAAVGQRIPDGLRLVGDVETLDYSPESVLAQLNEIIEEADVPVVVYMDAAYQFSVTYGVYAKEDE